MDQRFEYKCPPPHKSSPHADVLLLSDQPILEEVHNTVWRFPGDAGASLDVQQRPRRGRWYGQPTG